MSKTLNRRSLGLMLRSPGEFIDRASDEVEILANRLRKRPVYDAVDAHDAADELGNHLGRQVVFRDADTELAEAEIQERARAVSASGPFPSFYSAGPQLARFCFAVCRAVRPTTVVETGVAYGVTTAFILAALEMNGHGQLHSVDRPPWVPGGESHVGAAIPERLKGRWTLHSGSSKRVLPGLLSELGAVDVFVRDSLYTYRTVKRELRAAEPWLSSTSVVMADDLGRSAGFRDWAQEAGCPWWAAVPTSDPPRPPRFGVALGPGD
jgi:hypothetical protein